MVSEKFLINSEARGADEARAAAEDFGRRMGLHHHDALRLALLTEETLGMVKAMVDEFYGQMWFTSGGTDCEIHLQATANMDGDRKDALLSASTTGRNAASKGFMALIGDIISRSVRSLGRAIDAYGLETAKYGVVHAEGVAGPVAEGMTPIWTLGTYREDLNRQRDSDESAETAWDELEKSVVASLADDVIVGVRNDRIEMVIVKEFFC